jgi:integrase
MAINFLIKSRHGNVHYFRRRVPDDLRRAIGKNYLVKSLHTCDRRLAIILARGLASRTDQIFMTLRDMAKNMPDGELTLDYSLEIDLDELGRPSKIKVQAEPHEQESVNAALAVAMNRTAAPAMAISSGNPATSSGTKFPTAIDEYFEKAGLKPGSKATNRSKLNHAQAYFGEHRDVLSIDQKQLVEYAAHVTQTIENATTQGLYIQTVSGFLGWHRIRAGLTPLTTKTLIPKRNKPVTDDRDSFTLEQMKILFANAVGYRASSPHKFWVTVSVAFLGCRLEEIAQINIDTDLVHDAASDIWYLKFNELPDPDGIKRKSLKNTTSWRNVPIHSCLVRQGFIAFLHSQREGGASRPFEQEWQPRIVENVGSHKWSHYISRWGGRELDALEAAGKLKKDKLSYFHSMRHTFAGLLSNTGVPSELFEALCGRRHGGSDQERYEKLKMNHVRLSQQGVEAGLGELVTILDEVLRNYQVE